MPYYLIVYLGSIALLAKYLLIADPAVWAKILVAALMRICIANGLGCLHLGLAGLWLQVGISIYIALYLMYLKARF